MIVVTVSCCPPKLRGDLTKWLFEIDTGIFVGNLNARVRDAVWKRICENIGNGRATMVFNTNNEQKLDFRIHSPDWEAIDYDGIKLVRRIRNSNESVSEKQSLKIKENHIARIMQQQNKPVGISENYVVIDVETTGTEVNKAKIIEIGAVAVEKGKITERFSVLLKCDIPLPKNIIELTGITNEMLNEKGVEIKEALEEFIKFCGSSDLVGHNIKQFDSIVLQNACNKNDLPMMRNRLIDTHKIARRKLDDCENYSLREIAKYFEIEYDNKHRALIDCELTYRIYEKLKLF